MSQSALFIRGFPSRVFLARAIFLCAVAILVYLYSRPLGMFLLQDDWENWMFFSPGKGVNWGRVFGDFCSETSNGPGLLMYRATYGLFFALNFVLFGMRPGLWHISLIALHLGVLLLLLVFAFQLSRLWGVESRRILLPALLLCAVHPSHGEILSFLSRNAELSCSLGAIGALAFFHIGCSRALGGQGVRGSGPPLAVSLGFLALSFLSKELALGVPPTLCAHSLILLVRRRASSWRRSLAITFVVFAPFAVLTLLYLSIRAHLFGVDNVLSVYSKKITHDPLQGARRLVTFWAGWAFYHNPVQLSRVTRPLSIASTLVFCSALALVPLCIRWRRIALQSALFALHALLIGVCLSLPALWRLQQHDCYELTLFTAVALAGALAGLGAPTQGESRRPKGFLQGFERWHWAALAVFTVVFAAWAFLLDKQLSIFTESSQMNRRFYRLVNAFADKERSSYSFDILNLPRDYMGVPCAWRWSYVRYPYREREPSILPNVIEPDRRFCVVFDGQDQLLDLDSFRRLGKPIRSSSDGSLAILKDKCSATIVSNEPFAPRPNLHLWLKLHLNAPAPPSFHNVFLWWKSAGANEWNMAAGAIPQIVFLGKSLYPDYPVVISPGFHPLWEKDRAISAFLLAWVDYTLDNSLDLEIQEAVIYEVPQSLEARDASPLPPSHRM